MGWLRWKKVVTGTDKRTGGRNIYSNRDGFHVLSSLDGISRLGLAMGKGTGFQDNSHLCGEKGRRVIMAIWQFSCHVIPEEKADIGEVQPDPDEILTWGKQGEFVERIDFLEKRKSWSDKISQYGKEDETCIEFFYQNEELMEIHCRLDLRSLSRELLGRILNYVREIRGLIFCEGMIYSPNMDEITELIKKSNACRFCRDPEKFFQEMSR